MNCLSPFLFLSVYNLSCLTWRSLTRVSKWKGTAAVTPYASSSNATPHTQSQHVSVFLQQATTKK